MKKFNLSEDTDFKIKHNEKTFLKDFGGMVAHEVNKVEIKYDFTTRDHIFDDGVKGRVSQKLIIEIDFKDAIIQPHSSFEEEFCSAVASVLEENVNGLFENYDQN